MKRKVQALLLSFVLLLQLSPVFTVGASAAGAVTYNRETPPAAIFNAKNANNAEYYKSFATGSGQYNAVSHFTKNGSTAQLTASASVNFTADYGWSWDFANDTLGEIQQGGGLYANASGLFTNNWHKHRTGFLYLGSQDVLSYTQMRLSVGNDIAQSYSGMQFSRTADPQKRLGNGTWSALNNNAALRLNMYEPDITYNEGVDVCTCHTGSVSNIVVALMDAVGPSVASVTADSYTTSPGKTVTVTVRFSEPIRFADDATHVTGIKLLLDGHDSSQFATAELTGLNRDSLVFSCKIPETTDEQVAAGKAAAAFTGHEYTVSSIDLTPLLAPTGTAFHLKQVGAGGSFDVDPNKYSGEGYTTTTALITDLAGNPMTATSANLSTPMRIDGVAPTVASITQQAVTNNAKVKAALGKKDMSPTDKDYTDYSDTHLGAGDSVTFTANFSETLDTSTAALADLKTVKATTNLKNSDGNAVTVYYSVFRPVAATVTNEAFTALTFMPLTISSGMQCTDKDGKIGITKIDFLDASGNAVNVKDICGGVFDAAADLTAKNTNQEILDVTAPAVTTAIYPNETSNKYKPTAENDGFCFPFTIDVKEKEPLASIDGSFVLEPSDSAGSGTAFQYAVTKSTDEPANWSDGVVGTDCSFQQFELQRYLHIRPVEGVTYDLADPNLVFKPEDYAGNKGSTTFQLNWKKDGVAPSAAAGTPARQLTDSASSTGTLTVPVTVTDHSGFSEIKYAWGGETAPESWTDSGATFSTGASAVNFNIVKTVVNTNFSQHLWINAADASGNALIQDMGGFGYDLSSAVYTLTPSADYTDAAMAVSDLGSGAALAFLVHVPDDTNADYYYVRYITGNTADIFADYSNSTSYWDYLQVSVTGGNYTFSQVATDNAIDGEFNRIIAQNEYYGELTVIVLSGKKEAFTTTQVTGRDAISTAGSATYPVAATSTRLRAAAESVDGVYSVGITTTLTPGKAITKTGSSYTGFDPTDPNTYMYSSLTGGKFTLTISNTKVAAWGIDEIDFSKDANGSPKSYLAIKDKNDDAVRKYPLAPAKVDANGVCTLTVTLQDAEVPSGVYRFAVVLARKSGANELTRYQVSTDKDYRFYVDSSAAGATLLTGVAVDNTNMNEYGNSDMPLYPTAPDAGDAASPAVLRFPASNDYYKNGIYRSRLIFNVASPDSAEPAAYSTSQLCYGQRAARVWNVTAGQTEDDAKWNILVTNMPISSSDGKTQINAGISYRVQLVEDSTAAAAVTDKTILPMFGGQNNVIAVQTMCDNGKVSDVRYYTLFPVTAQVSGSFTTTRDGEPNYVGDSGELIFTPAQGQSMTGVKVYSCTKSGGKMVRTEMAEQLDGTYRCPLNKGLNNYYDVRAVDADNNYTIFPSLSAYIGYYLDSGAPVITPGTATDNGDGTYTVTYTVTDDANANSRAMTLHFSFDDDYLARLDQPAGSDLTLTLAKGESWSLPAGENNPLGIYSVSIAASGSGYQTSGTETTVTVKGAAKYNAAAVSCTLTPNISAADVFGNSSAAVSAPALTMNSVKPAITSAAFANSGDAVFTSDMALTVNFNQPVAIGKSWICQSPSGYTVSKKDEIPVTSDGTHNVAFYDVFGSLWQEDYEFNCFGEYGIDVTLSTTEPTKDDVVISAGVPGQYESPVVQLFYGNQSTYIGRSQSKAGGTDNQVWRYADAADYVNGGVRPDMKNPNHLKVDITRIYVTNIVTGAPKATVYYRFEASADVYKSGDTLPSSTSGKVTAWYVTDRNVTATNEQTFVFDAGTVKTYTFNYKDDFGSSGSATADLSGVDFTGGYVTPSDTEAPQIAVSVEGKRAGGYAARGSFGVSGTTVNGGNATIANALEKAGSMQSYNFAVTANDASPCKMVVLNSIPSAMTYDSAKSDTIAGVTVLGRNVYVDKTAAADFAVAVVDSAGNFSAFTVPHASLLFDNTPPALTAESVYVTLYDVYFFLKLSDKDDVGNTLAGVSLTAPDLPKWTAEQASALKTASSKDTSAHVGEYYYEFKYNGSVTAYASDVAGNTASQTLSVSEIDSSAPKLSAEWSPYYVDGEYSDKSLPAAGPVKTNVTVLVTSTKPVASYTAKYSTFDPALGTSSDYSENWSGKPENKPVISCSDTDKTKISVSFPADCVDVELTVTAINGRTAMIDVGLGYGVIDKTQFTVDSVQTDICRVGYSVPYAKTVTLKPTKSSFSTDGAGGTDENGNPIVYSSTVPLTVTVHSNGDYRYLFADRAGNVAAAQVKVTGIDNTAPTITTTPKDTSGMELTSGSTSVKVTLGEPGKVAANGNTYVTDSTNSCTLTFDKNGSYAIAAYDLAGNVSYGRVSIGNIDRDAPTIIFSVPTVKLVQGSSANDLKSQLDAGYTASDGEAQSQPTVSYDSKAVDLTKPGLYEVVYTVTDAAGNETVTVRWVQVYSKDLPLVTVDGSRADPNGTVLLKYAANHKLAVSNLADDEPYNVYLRKGLWSAGQMKGASNRLAVDSNGLFTMTGTGYFTLYIVTQSRQTFRALLYVEK